MDANPCAQSPGVSGREIARRLGISRNTVARYLSTEEVPRYKPREPRATKLGAFEAYIIERMSAAAPEIIIYIATDEGWLYLASLKDPYSGEIVGYAMSARMTKHLVMLVLFRAVATQRPPAGW